MAVIEPFVVKIRLRPSVETFSAVAKIKIFYGVIGVIGRIGVYWRRYLTITRMCALVQQH